MCLHQREEIRSAVANCLSIIYLKSKPLFYENCFEKLLRRLSNDSKESVLLATLRSIMTTESHEEFISSDLPTFYLAASKLLLINLIYKRYLTRHVFF